MCQAFRGLYTSWILTLCALSNILQVEVDQASGRPRPGPRPGSRGSELFKPPGWAGGLRGKGPNRKQALGGRA